MKLRCCATEHKPAFIWLLHKARLLLVSATVIFFVVVLETASTVRYCIIPCKTHLDLFMSMYSNVTTVKAVIFQQLHKQSIARLLRLSISKAAYSSMYIISSDVDIFTSKISHFPLISLGSTSFPHDYCTSNSTTCNDVYLFTGEMPTRN